jgi:hypothetical protein
LAEASAVIRLCRIEAKAQSQHAYEENRRACHGHQVESSSSVHFSTSCAPLCKQALFGADS